MRFFARRHSVRSPYSFGRASTPVPRGSCTAGSIYYWRCSATRRASATDLSPARGRSWLGRGSRWMVCDPGRHSWGFALHSVAPARGVVRAFPPAVPTCRFPTARPGNFSGGPPLARLLPLRRRRPRAFTAAPGIYPSGQSVPRRHSYGWRAETALGFFPLSGLRTPVPGPLPALIRSWALAIGEKAAADLRRGIPTPPHRPINFGAAFTCPTAF